MMLTHLPFLFFEVECNETFFCERSEFFVRWQTILQELAVDDRAIGLWELAHNRPVERSHTAAIGQRTTAFLIKYKISNLTFNPSHVSRE